MIKNFEDLVSSAQKNRKMTLSVAASEDNEVIIAVEEARQLGLIDAILVGDKASITKIFSENGFDINNYEIIDSKSAPQSARLAVDTVRTGKADFLMKGFIGTGDLLRAVLDKENGLRRDNLLSHVMAYSVATYNKLLLLTDGGMVTYPDISQKVQLINNAVKVAKALGISPIYVAALCAVETVNPDMTATTDAAALAKMSMRGQIKDCIVEGPLALDGAISLSAARHKGLTSPVAGQADILLAPNIESGNLLGKAITYFGGGKSAGIVIGAKCPIVLVSRADSHENKLNSIALGSLISNSK